MKKLISLILALVMTVSVLFGLNIAVYADDIPTHIGSNITVSYNSGTKTLTLSGTGKIEDQTASPFIYCFENNFGNKIVISSGITAIGENLFSGTTAFTSLELPDTLTQIGANAFSASRISVYNIPKSVISICDCAFAPSSDARSSKMWATAINVDSENNYFTSVDGVLYNKNITKLIQAPAAFSGTDGEFTVPDTVVNIGVSAFMKCLNLTKVTIPDSVEVISDTAFSLCKNLTEVVFENYRQNLNIAVSAFRYSYYDSATQQTTSILNNENMLFKAYQNTGALIYAKNNGISYEVLDPDVPVLTGWQKIDGKWYYYNADGSLRTGWLKSGGKWYLLAYADGHMLTGWAKAGGKWYYMNSSGAMLTGWQKVGGYWYYLNSSGAMLTGWQKVGGYWYYLNSSGAMQTGWIKLSGKWYYLNSNGTMRTANLTYKGKVYRFNKSGVCLNP